MDDPPLEATPAGSHDVTGLLLAWRSGNPSAFEDLIPLVYDELCRLAHRHLRGERHQPLQTAELVHESYVRLVDASRVDWQNRAHFFAVAARCMRRILVDAARARRSLKRGGDLKQVELDAGLTLAEAPRLDLLALDEALNSLAAMDERGGRVVELRFFGGLSVDETAQVLDVSPETVVRDWKVARAWLFAQLQSAPPGS